MDKELNDYYDALEDTFASKGWKLLTEDWNVSIAELDSVRGCTTIEQLHERRGRVDVLLSLVNLPEAIEAIKAQELEAESYDEIV